MNLWECQARDCARAAYGFGGAIGLMAIGWYFAKGPTIYCPQHHPGGWKVAEKQAEAIQAALVLVERLQQAVVGRD